MGIEPLLLLHLEAPLLGLIDTQTQALLHLNDSLISFLVSLSSAFLIAGSNGLALHLSALLQASIAFCQDIVLGVRLVIPISF